MTNPRRDFDKDASTWDKAPGPLLDQFYKITVKK